MNDDLAIGAKPMMLRDQVVEFLRAEIMAGRLEPGVRLVESDLCTSINVSRTSIREALRQLEAEGLVSNFPGRGPHVTVLSKRAAGEILDVLDCLIEKVAAKLDLVSDDTKRALTRGIEKKARKQSSNVATFKRNLIEISGNLYMQKVSENILHLTTFYLRKSLDVKLNQERLHSLFKDLLEAISAADHERFSRKLSDLLAFERHLIFQGIEG